MAKRFFVEGFVQGVGFRWFVRDAARNLNLVGFVRNLPDGRVEVLAEGEGEALESLREELRKGPRHAEVTSVRLVEEPASGRFRDFQITFS